MFMTRDGLQNQYARCVIGNRTQVHHEIDRISKKVDKVEHQHFTMISYVPTEQEQIGGGFVAIRGSTLCSDRSNVRGGRVFRGRAQACHEASRVGMERHEAMKKRCMTKGRSAAPIVLWKVMNNPTRTARREYGI